MNNVVVDLRRELLRVKLEKFILLGLRMDEIPCIQDSVVIYGAGLVGKLLQRCFDEKRIVFWDKKEYERDIYDIPVFSVEKGKEMILKDSKVTIIVTPVWDFENIRDDIATINPEVTIVSLEDLLEKI